MDNVNDALSIRLSEVEHSARRGDPLPPKETLEIIGILRGYMAFAETANRASEKMAELLAGMQ